MKAVKIPIAAAVANNKEMVSEILAKHGFDSSKIDTSMAEQMEVSGVLSSYEFDFESGTHGVAVYLVAPELLTPSCKTLACWGMVFDTQPTQSELKLVLSHIKDQAVASGCETYSYEVGDKVHRSVV